MQYRATTPQDNGFDNEHEELGAMREYIQSMMHKSGPGDLLDTVLVTINICEQRALLYQHHPSLHAWYTNTGLTLRGCLDGLTLEKDDHCPQEKLENPELYFPHVEHFH